MADPDHRGPQSVIELLPYGDDAQGRVRVEPEIAGRHLRLTYRWQSGPESLIVAAPSAAPQRRDELWRHSCAEVFLAVDSGSFTGGPYLEFNFAPTGDWAAYRFDSTRVGMRPHVWSGGRVPSIEISQTLDDLTLQALLPLEALPTGALRVAYASVLETSTGLSYWALSHPSDRPDFHHPAAFAASLELPT